ncbi:GNAT family N-acetyltransferase [Vibrio rumoiensis 1S-45]|uniref:Protein ElaA n=2 Tax=Vibrio rumoiensis TaxID=76258 RepID=A0A1E5DZP0_9VIBR|nr:GNAT family N-acetyltransferase [Vibrio rumoiensis 1S-45]
MQWECVTFEQLSVQQLYEMLKLRVDVFVVEQNCPYPELDNKDLIDGVYHLIGFQKDEIIACARLLPDGVSYETISIGRIATKQTHRGNGLGHQLMQSAIEHSQTIWGESNITIGAQAHLEAFYNQHGFIKSSEVYLEDDIPHIDMIRHVDEANISAI